MSKRWFTCNAIPILCTNLRFAFFLSYKNAYIGYIKVPYCKARKEEGRVRYQSTRHDFLYNRRCFWVNLKGPGSLNGKNGLQH
jgi:hypothetical protein